LRVANDTDSVTNSTLEIPLESPAAHYPAKRVAIGKRQESQTAIGCNYRIVAPLGRADK
jgi:hypothetical protein